MFALQQKLEKQIAAKVLKMELPEMEVAKLKHDAINSSSARWCVELKAIQDERT